MAFSNLKVGTLNCRGLNHLIKAKCIASFLKRSNFDIVCLQETYLKKDRIFQQASKAFPLQYLAPGSSKSKGVAILISNNLDFIFSDSELDPQGRFIFIKGTLNSENVTIASVYTPNDGQVGFFKTILEKLKSFQKGHIIIGTDLNYTVDKYLDIKRLNQLNSKRKSKSSGPSAISQLLSSHDLIEVWRFFNTTDKSYTFFSPRYGTYSRIDYLFTSSSLIPFISSSEIGLIQYSDHAPVFFTFQNQEHNTTFKNWSLNNDLLEDPLLVNKIEEHLIEYFALNNTNDVSAQTLWEASKAVIRGLFLSLAASRKKHKAQLVHDLNKNIEYLSALHKRTCNSKVYAELQIERKKLETLESSQFKNNLRFLKQKYFVRHSKTLHLLVSKIKQLRTKKSHF